MNIEMENVIKERFEKLSPEVAIAIKAIPWAEKIKLIAKNNNLDTEKEELFIIETALVVLGIEPPTKYPLSLAENVGLNDDVVIKIAKEVDEQIITPILKMLEKNKPPANIKGSDNQSAMSKYANKYLSGISSTSKLKMEGDRRILGQKLIAMIKEQKI